MDRKQILRENLEQVRSEIASACIANGRSPDSVKLIAITKYVDAAVVRELFHLGCNVIGESRPQVLLEKRALLSDLPMEWHLVGHLQSNKAKRMVTQAEFIHSIDSWDLLHDIERHAAAASKPIKCLLEVHISGEASKTGFAVEELSALAEQAADLQYVSLVGCMGMAELDAPEQRVRQQFSILRQCRERWQGQMGEQHPLNEFSMGMSSDFVWAIAEGATMVRIGSQLFKGLV